MKKKLLLIYLLIYFSLFPFQTSYSQETSKIQPAVNSQSCMLINIDSGQVLYSRNMNERMYPASTTKILTALIVLERCSLSDMVTVGSIPPYVEGSKIYLFEDEQLTVEQLMYAMLLESANDCAVALAEHVSGSVEAFAELMNQRAKEIGCTSSNFVNPNGLSDENHYTTAYDLALISIEAMKNPSFCEIVTTLTYQIPPTSKQPETRYLNNHNKLLPTRRYYYEGVDGVKNGYTTASKSTLVASCMRDGLHLMAVCLNCSSVVYKDAISLFDYGYSNYSNMDLLHADTLVSTVFLKDSDASIDLYPAESLSVAVPIGTTPKVSEKITLTSDFSLVNAGDEVGYIELSLENDSTYTIPLVALEDYDNSAYASTQLTNEIQSSFPYWRGILLLGILTAITIIVHKKRRLS